MLEQPAAVAKKAEGASRVVFLTPSPLNQMGKHVWLSPEMSMLMISLKRDLRCRSKLWSSGNGSTVMTSTCTVLWVLQMHVERDNRHHVLVGDKADCP